MKEFNFFSKKILQFNFDKRLINVYKPTNNVVIPIFLLLLFISSKYESIFILIV